MCLVSHVMGRQALDELVPELLHAAVGLRLGTRLHAHHLVPHQKLAVLMLKNSSPPIGPELFPYSEPVLTSEFAHKSVGARLICTKWRCEG